MNSSVHTQLLFVFLWSSAYIAIEFCSAHIEPATFVVIRAIITANILLYIVVTFKVDWPRRRVDFFHCSAVGILIHGIYGGGVFASIYYGIDVALCALILSFQPLLTVLLSSTFLGEKITQQKAVGILLGLIGVAIVILESSDKTTQFVIKNGNELSTSNGVFATALACVALLAISSATVLQKQYCGKINPVSGTCIQYAATAYFMLPIALAFETMQINMNINFIFGLGWLIIFVSMGAMVLLMTLIKQGDAGSVANLFYIVTPLVAIEAWVFFGDRITPISLVGMLLCTTGVIVANFVPAVKPGSLRVST